MTTQTPEKRGSSRRKSGPTIRDVASACGVSAMTVSYVLNNRHTEVSPVTRERVLSAMRDLNFQPSAVARALSRKKTDTIGVMFGIVGAADALANSYMAGILRGVLQAAKARSYDINILTRDWVSEKESASAFNDERTDGTLLIAPSTQSDIVRGLKSLGKPLVTISGDAVHEGVVSVDMNDDEAGRLVMDHLIALGHRRIAHITGNMDMISSKRRESMYRAASIAAGIERREAYLIQAEYSGLGASDAVALLMALPEPPTAVFCGNDNIAFEAMASLIRRGYDVPGDVSIVGVDDVDAAALVTPSLTTVHQPLPEIGAAATTLLIDLIGGIDDTPTSHMVAPRLIVRASTSSPKEGRN